MFIGPLSSLSSGGSHGVVYSGSGYLGLTWSSCGVAHRGKGLIFVFQEFSASIGEALVLVGDWALGCHSFCGVWILSSYFLVS